MFRNLLFNNYNATICDISMQSSSGCVDSKLLKLWPILGSQEGSKLTIEKYMEKRFKSSCQKLQCYN